MVEAFLIDKKGTRVQYSFQTPLKGVAVAYDNADGCALYVLTHYGTILAHAICNDGKAFIYRDLTDYTLTDKRAINAFEMMLKDSYTI